VIPNRLPEPVSLHLVNPDTGRPIQTWLFEAQKSVRIGRAEGNDVVISDPSVSRFHAELQFNGVEWELVNLGKNGTLISSHSISRVKIDQQTLFRLGTGGPLLRFERSGEAFDTLNTVMNAVAPPQPIQIDARRSLRSGQSSSLTISSISRVFPQSFESGVRNRVDGIRVGV
jgi:pSer/pThr/pTyr-binding forkhead associated (FHA) protein